MIESITNVEETKPHGEELQIIHVNSPEALWSIHSSPLQVWAVHANVFQNNIQEEGKNE